MKALLVGVLIIVVLGYIGSQDGTPTDISSEYSSMPQESTVLAGNWDKSSAVDQMTGEVDYSISLKADSEYVLDPVLKISCKSNKTSLEITWFEIMSYFPVVSAKIDDGPINKEGWSKIPAGTGYPNADYEFVKSLIGSDKLVARLHDKHSPKTVTFDLAGLEEAVQDVRSACNW